MTTVETLKNLGFTTAAKRVQELRDRKRKLAIAYEHFRFVRDEKIRAFNTKLFQSTMTRDGSYKELSLVKIEEYAEVPPAEVLAALGQAMEKKCFDSFEVASIREVQDPILFGRIDDCSDHFFIAQWDEDVKISDLLGENEG